MPLAAAILIAHGSGAGGGEYGMSFDFSSNFSKLTGSDGGSGPSPFPWQTRLFDHLVSEAPLSAIDLPTGLGKTSAMIVWLIARAVNPRLPTRLVYVVDRRAVVDKATDDAVSMRANLPDDLAQKLGIGPEGLAISTLRGSHADNRAWLDDPSRPSIIIGTVDMIGSRLLFSGYGVSRGMRPVHAALLGTDSLVMLDEAHLSRPFQRLLSAVESSNNLWPQAHPRPLKLLPLSATGAGVGDAAPFRLDADDRANPEIARRLSAIKRLCVLNGEGDKPDQRLAKEAEALLDAANAPVRLLIYVSSRDAAEKLATQLAPGKTAPTRKVLLLTGARRGAERDAAAAELAKEGFVAGSARPDHDAILIATSAGEVGVDLDADHMICDLVPWERMVQRLGRVNRRGGRAADIIAVDFGADALKTWPKDDREAELARRTAARAMLRRLPAISPNVAPDLFETSPARNLVQAGPGAISDLAGHSENTAAIAEASTPEPLHPPLRKALVEAWSQTAIDVHPGRPEVAPWLRGWVEDAPQTEIVWRRHLPVRLDADGRHQASEGQVRAFFEAAPVLTAEKLEAATDRVLKFLFKKVEGFAKRGHLEAEADPVIALLLDRKAELREALHLSAIARAASNQNASKRLFRALAGATLVLDARLGGLANGLLSDKSDETPATADAEGGWDDALRDHAADPLWRVIEAKGAAILATPPPDAKLRQVLRLDLEQSEDGAPVRALIVRRQVDGGAEGEIGSIARRAQTLAVHRDAVAQEAKAIADRCGLDEPEREALERAAQLHDDGKDCVLWQRAMGGNPRGEALAKTTGRAAPRALRRYRHEFGSLLKARSTDLPEATRDLTLHLIAAHHGHARPLIRTAGVEDAPPTTLESAALEVAMRFATLQARYGPWGLAWREELLRAADRRASRLADQEGA